MTARKRFRTFILGAAAAALIAPMAMVAATTTSASAAVGPRPHEVYMYKVEKHVDLSGEFPDNYGETYLSCNDGDYAVDGMWRVDHVDQANPQIDVFGDERDVVFYASYSSSKSQWYYRYENFADGNAQIKLFLTCIRQQTEQTAGHKHDIVLTDPIGYPHHGLTHGTYQNFYHDAACPTGYYAVAPGFNFVHDERNRIIGNYPTPDFRGWQWAFVVEQDNTDLDVAFRCLSDKVAPNFGHRHALPMLWRPNSASPYDGYDDHTWNNGIQEKVLSCGQNPNGAAYHDYKAMVGAFWIYDWDHVWYLGMDPRPKKRAYKFWDQGGGGHILTNILCVKSRTGKQIKPF